MLSEFEALGEVMGVANDNTVSISFEGLVGNPLRVSAVDLSKLEGDFQYVPYEGLSEEVAKIQEVKIAYFEHFWEPSGKVAVSNSCGYRNGGKFSLNRLCIFDFLLS